MPWRHIALVVALRKDRLALAMTFGMPRLNFRNASSAERIALYQGCKNFHFFEIWLSVIAPLFGLETL